MNNELAKKITEAIKEKDIHPTPRWHFIAKNYTIWGIGALLLVVGGLAFSVVLFMVVHNDWELYDAVHDSFLGFVFLSLPYFWIILLAAFLVAGEFYIRHTEKGYRYSLHMIIISILLGNVVLGTTFYALGLGQAIDEAFIEHVPTYDRFIGGRHIRWAAPYEGRLSGRVLDVNLERVMLQDIQGRPWEVVIIDARIATGTEIIPDALLKMVGTVESEQVFRAYHIVPAGAEPGFYKFRKGNHMIPKPPHIDFKY